MIITYYQFWLLLSAALTILYVIAWHKHYDVHITLIFAIVPITNFGFLAVACSDNLREAILANKISYFGGTFLVLILTLTILRLCSIHISRWIKAAMFFISTLVYFSVLFLGYQNNSWFYRSYDFRIENGVGYIINKEYGVMHTVFIIVVMLYFAIGFGSMVYAYFFRKDVPKKVILFMFLPELLCMFSFLFGRQLLTDRLELLPAAYVFAQVMYLVIVRQVCLYDITDSGIDSLVQTGDKGFLSFDFRRHYLGCNQTALHIFPELSDVTVDTVIRDDNPAAFFVNRWLDAFEEDEGENSFYYHHDDRIYLVSVTYLYSGKRKRGYQFFLSDDTKQQQYVELLNHFNTQLKEQVDEKTRHIVEMHDNLILSMAVMVESRDNSTGGHIRRTSEGVRILMKEIRRGNEQKYSDEFTRDIIKAAPMHDLGKIAVDDVILRKPGRFEPWEFEKMKAHASEGARIVHTILKGTDDETFHHIAENMAHYHHERWDGSGYPEGLQGEQIPIEARIMAIADVYDALVSKRVYKDSMSFAQADEIIMGGMGSQFDPDLKPYYIAARPSLEAYYRSQGDF